MTQQDAEKSLQNLQDIAKQLGYTIDNLWEKNPLTYANQITAEFIKWDDELKQIKGDLGGLNSILKQNLQDLTKSNVELNISRKSSRDLVSISSTLLQDKLKIIDLGKKELDNLKIKVEKNRLFLKNSIDEIKAKGDLSDISEEELASIEDNYRLSSQLLDITNSRVIAEKQVNKALGLTSDLAEGIGKTMHSFGFGKLADQLGIDDAIKKNREFAQDLIETKRNNASKIPGGNPDLVSVSSLDRLKTAGNVISNLGKNLVKSLGPLTLLLGIVDAVMDLDKSISETAKNLGTSYEEAAKLSSEFNSIASSSDNIFVTTAAINEAFNTLSTSLGTNGKLSGELLVDFTELTKQAGYSVEAATQLSKLSLSTGKTSKELAATYLGQVKALSLQNNLAINGKQILNDIANTSKNLLATYSKQPQKLAEAAFEAQKLGASLKEIEGIQNSLLDIESSISNEFEAEVMTGRSLNLERARYYALTNDIAGLSKEINKQGIDLNSWSGMNVLQQDSIAKSMGLSKDQMADMLLTSSALSKVGLLDNEENRKKLQYLKEHGGSLEAINELGQEELDRQMKSASVQDRFTQSVEKLKELFVGIAEPLMPLLDVLGDALGIVGKIIKLLDPVIKTVGVAIKGLGVLFSFSQESENAAKQDMNNAHNQLLDSISNNWGINLSKPQTVQDGMAPSSKGPFTVTDRYGATSVTTDGDNIVVSPNINTQPQNLQQKAPSIINNIPQNNEGSITTLSNTLGNKMDQMIGKLDILIYTMKNGMVVNLDGNRVSQELGTPMAIATRRI